MRNCINILKQYSNEYTLDIHRLHLITYYYINKDVKSIFI